MQKHRLNKTMHLHRLELIGPIMLVEAYNYENEDDSKSERI